MEIHGGGKYYAANSITFDKLSGNGESKQEKDNGVTKQSTVINISSEALERLEKTETSEKVNTFLAEKGERIYELAIKSLKTYPENLQLQLETDTTLSPEDKSELANKRNERELEAFGKYAKQSPPDIKQYYENYIEYLDSLSPEEQQSERYNGQRAIAVSGYERAAREQGEEPRDFSFTQDPILALFDLIVERDFVVEDGDTFLDHYENLISPLLEHETKGEAFKADAELALARFDAVHSVIDAARNGDSIAFEELQKLGNNKSTIDEFITYSTKITQIVSE